MCAPSLCSRQSESLREGDCDFFQAEGDDGFNLAGTAVELLTEFFCACIVLSIFYLFSLSGNKCSSFIFNIFLLLITVTCMSILVCSCFCLRGHLCNCVVENFCIDKLSLV